MFRALDLFVYSGTGNTYKAAQCIGETAKGRGTEYAINMIDAESRPGGYKPSADRLLGLLAPTIGAIQPMSFFGFVIRLPKGNRQRVFLAATGAWTRIGPLFIPGYVGFGLYLAALIMWIKGYNIVGVTGFGMAHNWTTLIPPYRKSLENRINDEIRITTADFINRILSGERVFNRVVDLVITVLIFPLPLLFILYGHLMLAKTLFAGAGCNGCGLCVANCPRRAVKLLGKKRKRPYWTYRCEQCMRCAGFCPREAVDCNSFLVLAFAVLAFAVPVDAVVNHALSSFSFLSALPGYAVLLFVIDYAAVLLVCAAVYAVFYLLSRVPPINKAFTVLSFTHYWRKYKQEEVGIDQLTKKRK